MRRWIVPKQAIKNHSEEKLGKRFNKEGNDLVLVFFICFLFLASGPAGFLFPLQFAL